VKTKLPSVKNYDLFRYTLQQKQSLYDFIKIKIQEKTPLKQIFFLVKRKFPWYMVNSQTAFKIYWECLKDEFRTYGSPDADDAYARRKDAARIKRIPRILSSAQLAARIQASNRMGSCQMCGSKVEHLNRSTDDVKMCDYCFKSQIGKWILNNTPATDLEYKTKNAHIGMALAQCFNVLEQRLKSMS